MKELDVLTETEKKSLLKFPAYITLLATNRDMGLDAKAKNVSIKFAHMKTFTCDPILNDFYKEAEKVFEENLTELNNELPKGKEKREDEINKELLSLEPILLKLGREYAATMHRSMKSFKDHVSKAHHSILEDFIFPIPIKGLND